MPDVVIRHPLPEEHVSGFARCLATALLRDETAESAAVRAENMQRYWPRLRTWGALAENRVVATLATEARTISVPAPGGGTTLLEADALTGVSVAGTHRRRGLLTRMLTASLAEARERGDAISILIAAEWPIYGRFGYAPAADSADYSLFPRRRLATTPKCGTVREIDKSEAVDIGRRTFDAQRGLWPGQVDRSGPWWPAHLHSEGYRSAGPDPNRTWVVADGPDGPEGLLSWSVVRSDWNDPRGMAIEVGNLVAGSWPAYRALWGYVSALDLVEEILLPVRPIDEPARWLLGDGRALEQRVREDAVWVRLLDVPAALTARGYGCADRLVLEIVDPAPGRYADGTVLLETDGSQASCAATTQSPDLRLSQRALASAYLGGHSLAELSVAGEIEELTAGTLRRADAMFSVPRRPWNPTGF
jgi:predicted acetyltransferase